MPEEPSAVPLVPLYLCHWEVRFLGNFPVRKYPKPLFGECELSCELSSGAMVNIGVSFGFLDGLVPKWVLRLAPSSRLCWFGIFSFKVSLSDEAVC